MEIKQITGSSCFVTSDGQILSKEKKLRKPKLTKTGYLEISIYFGKEIGKKSFRVHRLVAEYFIDNPNNKPFVNHLDGVKTNNSVENLEWVTHSENMEHAKNFGLIHRAEKNHNTEITTEDAETICKMMSFGYRNNEISKSLNISVAIIASIRAKVCWNHISCKYNIPKRSRSLSCKTIEWICKKITEGLTTSEILSISTNSKITKNVIKDIRRRRIYKDISSKYKI